jgi:hypothetical protein
MLSNEDARGQKKQMTVSLSTRRYVIQQCMPAFKQATEYGTEEMQYVGNKYACIRGGHKIQPLHRDLQ